MAFVSDTFTDTNGVDLDSHTGETGATWTEHGSSGTKLEIQSNQLTSVNTSLTGLFYASGAPANNEYDVEADVIISDNSVTTASGIAGRMSTSANTFYLARLYVPSPDPSAWHLYKFVAGSATLLGSYEQAVSNTTYALKLEIRDSAKKLYVDGVERISSSNDDITADGKAGIRIYVTDTTAYHFDNFVATDVAGGVTVSATTASITASAVQSGVNAKKAITATTAAISSATYQASITVGANTNITATTASIAGSAVQAVINAKKSITATTAAISSATYQASITTGLNITASTAAISATANTATIKYNWKITSTTAAANLAAYQATITSVTDTWTIQSKDSTSWSLQAEDTTSWTIQ